MNLFGLQTVAVFIKASCGLLIKVAETQCLPGVQWRAGTAPALSSGLGWALINGLIKGMHRFLGPGNERPGPVIPSTPENNFSNSSVPTS